MIAADENMKHGMDPHKSMVKQEEDINDGLRSYFSKADQFAVRMSSALKKSGLVKKSLVGEQNDLFIDKANVNLVKSGLGEGLATIPEEQKDEPN